MSPSRCRATRTYCSRWPRKGYPLLETLIAGGDPAFTDCINDAVDDALLRRYVVALFVTDPGATDPDLETTFATIYTSCQPATPSP